MNPNQKADLPEPWQWPGLWSVNLPVLIVLWQVLFAQTFFVWLGAHHLLATAALAWGFLALERWVYLFRVRPDVGEGLLPPEQLGEQKASLVRICLLILVGLLLVGYFHANIREMGGVLIWTSLGGLYLTASRATPWQTSEVLPREIAIPIYLAGTVALFVWANGVFTPLRLLLPTLLFLLLLFYYLCLVSGWAKALLPQVPGGLLDGSMATFYRGMPVLLILAAAVMVLVSPHLDGKALILTIGVSAGMLLLLDLWQRSFSPFACRLLADAALLAPVLPLLIGV